jgi:ankyrin repeat protein
LACYFGHSPVAAYLIENGADVNAVANNDQLIQPLHAATANSNLEIIQMLLENGANVNAVQAGNITALHSAAHHGNIPLGELLLKYGADVELETAEGKKAADLAKDAAHSAFVDLL